MYIGLHVRGVPRVSDFKGNLNLSTNFRKKSRMQIFIKIRLVGI